MSVAQVQLTVCEGKDGGREGGGLVGGVKEFSGCNQLMCERSVFETYAERKQTSLFPNSAEIYRNQLKSRSSRRAFSPALSINMQAECIFSAKVLQLFFAHASPIFDFFRSFSGFPR